MGKQLTQIILSSLFEKSCSKKGLRFKQYFTTVHVTELFNFQLKTKIGLIKNNESILLAQIVFISCSRNKFHYRAPIIKG